MILAKSFGVENIASLCAQPNETPNAKTTPYIHGELNKLNNEISMAQTSILQYINDGKDLSDIDKECPLYHSIIYKNDWKQRA